MTATLTTRRRRAEQTIHPARRVTGAALAVVGAAGTVAAVVAGVSVLLAAVGLVGVGFVVSHRWTRLDRAEVSRLDERDGSVDYSARRSA